MSVLLLDNTRKITNLLHHNKSSKVVFNDICKVLTECLDSNILVLSNKGKVLGSSTCGTVEEIKELISRNVGDHIDERLNARLLNVLSTQDNVNLNTFGFENIDISKTTAIISPIEIAGDRLGTIFVYRSYRSFDIDDIILTEYGTTVVGLEILRSENEANVEEKRKKQVVRSAISTLSSSEISAAIHIFNELDGNEGTLIASKIADEAKITRSVIVNALRKFESAGVIKAKSGGMKGTYIKITNEYLLDEIAALNTEN